jgi:beta-glucosidase
MLIVSGRPLLLDSAQRDEADAIMAACLTDYEAGAVADMLLGARRFPGKLPVSWPRALA